uniref:PIK helical domain-containing protein n=1 Tax=Ascaris lumbricoides TaxID=6252 RepID=A0A0M3HMT4_ASCLU
MCSLLMQESDEQMDAELNASLASGIFNMVDAKVFIEEHMRGRTHFALYVLHRFMLSLKKPIASQHNIIRAFCTDGDAPVEAWQCLFYALLSLVSLLCYDNCTTAAQLLALWYTGEKANEVSAQIDSYLQKSIQPIKLVS